MNGHKLYWFLVGSVGLKDAVDVDVANA